MQKNINKNRLLKIKGLFSESPGLLRSSEAIKAGIQPRELASLVERGVLEKVSRGLYRLAALPPLGSPDIVTVAARIPQGVLCLVTALVFHELTTQVPREVQVALQAGAEKPRLDFPPTKYYWFSGKAYSDGIEVHAIDGLPIKVYSIEKSLADCFKFRNKIGIDVAVEAFRAWAPTNRRKWDELLHFAKICRVEKLVRQYLEAMA